jgi:prenylcysteine oxidase / farnesylcysteine lyase
MKPMELGASIFVRANKNLWRASDEFNLTRLDFEEKDSTMGIWDGHNFLLTVSLPLTSVNSANYMFSSQTGGGGYLSDWWNTLKVLWRYGYAAPTQTQKM